MVGKGATAGCADAYAGLRLACLEPLLDDDKTCFFQRIQMGSEISIGRSNKRLQPSELDCRIFCRNSVQCCHDPQSHRLVDDLIGLTHLATPCRWSQMPPRMRVPLCETAIQRRSHGSP